MQSIYELNIDIACVSELASAPQISFRWAVSSDGLAAIYFGTKYLIDKCIIYHTDKNFVVIKYKQCYIASVYIVSSVNDRDFNVTLDKLSTVNRMTGGDCIISVDFNAKSLLWGSPRTKICFANISK